MKKHILVVSQHFYPEHFRINDICEEWVKRGYKVSVLTGIPNYPKGSFYKGYGWFKNRKQKYNGIDIIRIPILPRKNNRVMLFLNYLSFMAAGGIWKMFTRLEADIVFINQTSPMTQAFPGVWYAKRKKIPCYIYVKDLWPESVQIITGMKNKFILCTLGKMVDYIYERCNKIFTTSEGFKTRIQLRGVDKEKVIYWPQYAEDVYRAADKNNVKTPEIDTTKFNLVFAGNFGQAQGLEILPKTALLLKQKGLDIVFNMVGDGRYKKQLLEQTEEVSSMFNFIERQPAHRIPDIMAVCDATLIILSKSEIFELTIPAKTQSCLACAVPIIVSADGEVAKVIMRAQAGLSSDAGNVTMLADNIERFYNMTKEQRKRMAQSGFEYYKSTFDKEKLLTEMDKYIMGY